MKMFVFEALKQSSWLTLTLFGISVYWILKKLAERIRISDLKHKAVFITNCDGEIGQEIALKCAKHDLIVYAGFSKIESRLVLEQRARQTQTHLITVPFDMSDDQAIKNAVDFVRRDLPKDTKLWALVNTPNECNNHDPHQIDEFKAAMEFNYMSEIRCTHAFIPLLKKSKGGRIAITKSIPEELVLRWGNAKLNKTALNSYLENLAMELQYTKIKVGVFEQHGVTSTRNIVKAYYHFISGRFPYPYYKCGPSVLFRSIYFFLIGWIQSVKSLIATRHKEKAY